MPDPALLTTDDERLIQGAEVAHLRASELLQWWKKQHGAKALKHFYQPMPRARDIKLECFYDTLELGGKPGTVMACSWKSRFSRKASSGAAAQLAMDAFIHKEFMRQTKWQNPDGLPGGFEFIPRLYKRSGCDEYGVLPEGSLPTLDEIGPKYDWLVMEAVVHDFFRNFPGPPMKKWLLAKLPRMASYVLVHPEYLRGFSEPVPGSIAEGCFGYSFLPIPVVKTIFGYGPGQFAAAVKQFRWILHQNSDVEIEMFFLVSGRSEKILSLWGGFDPVYFTAKVANALTINRLRLNQRVHDKLDAAQLSMHARVYQSLIEGMRKSWEEQNWAEAYRTDKGSQDA